MEKRNKHHVSPAIVELQGSLTISTIEETEKRWYNELNDSPEILAIDFTRVNFIDSTSIGALVKLLNYCNGKNISILLFNVTQPVQDVFDAVKLGKYFTILTLEEFSDRFSK